MMALVQSSLKAQHHRISDPLRDLRICMRSAPVLELHAIIIWKDTRLGGITLGERDEGPSTSVIR